MFPFVTLSVVELLAALPSALLSSTDATTVLLGHLAPVGAAGAAAATGADTARAGSVAGGLLHHHVHVCRLAQGSDTTGLNLTPVSCSL